MVHADVDSSKLHARRQFRTLVARCARLRRRRIGGCGTLSSSVSRGEVRDHFAECCR